MIVPGRCTQVFSLLSHHRESNHAACQLSSRCLRCRRGRCTCFAEISTCAVSLHVCGTCVWYHREEQRAVYKALWKVNVLWQNDWHSDWISKTSWMRSWRCGMLKGVTGLVVRIPHNCQPPCLVQKVSRHLRENVCDGLSTAYISGDGWSLWI